MRRHDDLCAGFCERAETAEEFQLAQYRQSGLGFVEEDQRFGTEATFGQRHDGLAVTHLGEVRHAVTAGETADRCVETREV